MKRKLLIFLLMLLIIFISGFESFAKQKFSIDEFGKFMAVSLKEWKVPGAAVGIINKGYIILAKGYGFRNVEKKLPVTRKTLFSIGSTTKAFTSFLVGQLVDDGKIVWNGRVRSYLPDFTLYDNYASTHMKVKDLLIHNSGLPRHDLVWYGADYSRKELYNGLKYLKNSADFRETFQYQNMMYMTAGYLVGKMRGSTWEHVIKNRLFKPLEMISTNLSIAESLKSDDFSKPYAIKKGKIVEVPFYKKGIKGIAPAGAINSNIDDMLSWLKLILDGGRRGGKQFISPGSLKVITTPQVIAGGTIAYLFNRFNEFSFPTYGMGWFINHYRGHNLIHHGGNIDGFSAVVSFMPDIESGVIILTNNSGNFLTYSATLRVYDGLMGEKPLPWNKRFLELFETRRTNAKKKMSREDKSKVAGTKPSHSLKEYTGKFNHPAYGVILLTSDKNGLKFKYHKFSGKLSHYHYDYFKIEDTIFKGSKLHFLTDDKGIVDRVLVPLEPTLDDIVFKRMIPDRLNKKSYLEKFSGNYLFTAGQLKAKIFFRGDDKLFLQATGQPEFQLKPFKKNFFSLKGLKGFTVEFLTGPDGKATGFISHQPNGDFKAKRI